MSKYVSPGEPVAILFEDAGVRIFNKPPNLHRLSTVGIPRGFERVGIIDSADKVIHEMTPPSKQIGAQQALAVLLIYRMASTNLLRSEALGRRTST